MGRMSNVEARGEGRRIALAAILAIAPIIVLCAIHAPVYATPPDDFVQELFARDQFMAAESGGLMPYSLVLVSAPLSALYHLAPGVPWYALTLLALIAASFAIAWREVLSLGLGVQKIVAVGAVMVLLEAIFTWYFTYTMVAFLTLAAGLLLIVPRACFQKTSNGGHGPAATTSKVPVDDSARPHLADVGGLALVAIGFSLRPESGMAALAVFAPFAVWVVARNRRAASLVRMALVVAVVAASWGAGQLAYRTAPGWEGFSDYLDAGRKVLDTQHLSVDEARAAAPQLSENDVEVLFDWDFVDHDVFGTGVFEQVGGSVSTYGADHLIASLKAKITYLLIGLAALFALIVAVVCRELRLEGSVRVLAAAVALMVLIDLMLIVMRGRPRLHVVIPVVATGVFALIACARGPRRHVGRHAARAVSGAAAPRLNLPPFAVPVAVSLICAVGFAGFYLAGIRPLQRRTEGLPFASATQAYVDSHPDEIVAFLHTQATWFSVEDAFASSAWKCPDNVMFVGGWESETLPWATALERWGLDEGSPLLSMATRGDMVAVAQPAVAKLMETYLREHVDDAVRAVKVEDLGPGAVTSDMLSVYRFERG